MALRTAVKNGLWSDATVWGGTVPLTGDSIAMAGYTVEFDVDQTAFVTGMTITGTGTLKASRTVSTVLKAASINGPVLDWGTEADPIPANINARITVTNGPCIRGTGHNFVGIDPAHPTILMTADAAAGLSVISVDTDVSAEWQVGDTVRIDSAIANSSIERTITAITANTITLNTTLGTARKAGDFVHRVTRNVSIVGAGQYLFTYCIGGTFRCLIQSGNQQAFLEYCDNNRIIGGCANGNAALFGLRSMGNVISGGVQTANNGVFVGNTNSKITGGLQTANNIMFQTRCFGCSITGGQQIANGHIFYEGCIDNTIIGSVLRNNTAIFNSTCWNNFMDDCVVDGTTIITSAGANSISFSSHFKNLTGTITKVTDYPQPIRLNNCAVNDNAFHNNYNLIPGHQLYMESQNHGRVDGAYYAAMYAGTVRSVTDVFPEGKEISFKMTGTSTTHAVHHEYEQLVHPGETVKVSGWMRKSATTAWTPRIWITETWAGQDDTVPLAEAVMTDSVDTWEKLDLQWTNDTGGIVTVKVLGVALGNGLNTWWHPEVSFFGWDIDDVGDNRVIFSIHNGAELLADSFVRVGMGGHYLQKTTDVTGEVYFDLNTAQYEYWISKEGYATAFGIVDVNSDEEVSVELVTEVNATAARNMWQSIDNLTTAIEAGGGGGSIDLGDMPEQIAELNRFIRIRSRSNSDLTVVVRGDKGEPIRNATVTVIDANDEVTGRDNTRSNGRVVLPRIAHGVYEITVEMPDKTPQTRSVNHRGTSEFDFLFV